MALIGQAVSEKNMFENNVHVHVHSPGQGQTTWVIFLSKNSNINLLIWSFPLNDIVTVFPIQTHSRSWSTQGHYLY